MTLLARLWIANWLVDLATAPWSMTSGQNGWSAMLSDFFSGSRGGKLRRAGGSRHNVHTRYFKEDILYKALLFINVHGRDIRYVGLAKEADSP